MGICSLKTHGFQHSVFDLVAFLHGKTTVFPTPFPEFQSNYGATSPEGGQKAIHPSLAGFPLRRGAKAQFAKNFHPVQRSCPPLNLSTVGGEGNFNTKHRRLEGRPYETNGGTKYLKVYKYYLDITEQ
jgi:hypothetical protein